jgi:hypothetical protein
MAHWEERGMHQDDKLVDTERKLHVTPTNKDGNMPVMFNTTAYVSIICAGCFKVAEWSRTDEDDAAAAICQECNRTYRLVREEITDGQS